MEHEKKVSFQLLVLITTPKLAEHAAETVSYTHLTLPTNSLV